MCFSAIIGSCPAYLSTLLILTARPNRLTMQPAACRGPFYLPPNRPPPSVPTAKVACKSLSSASATQNWFSQINTRCSLCRAKESCSNQRICKEISLCAKFLKPSVLVYRNLWNLSELKIIALLSPEGFTLFKTAPFLSANTPSWSLSIKYTDYTALIILNRIWRTPPFPHLQLFELKMTYAETTTTTKNTHPT